MALAEKKDKERKAKIIAVRTEILKEMLSENPNVFEGCETTDDYAKKIEAWLRKEEPSAAHHVQIAG